VLILRMCALLNRITFSVRLYISKTGRTTKGVSVFRGFIKSL
jgi:hypothetical protein